jgi:hypothetical protein
MILHRQVQQTDKELSLLPDPPSRNAIQLAEVVESLADSKVRVQAALLGHKAEPLEVHVTMIVVTTDLAVQLESTTGEIVKANQTFEEGCLTAATGT